MKIRELLSDESKWVKGSLARDSALHKVHPLGQTAVCWCLEGALIRCYPRREDLSEVSEKVENELCLPHCTIFYWNDNHERTFDEVKSLVEKLDI